MVVLGLSPNHDSSICLVVDGKIVSAITRERLSRVKKDRYITQRMIDYVLYAGGLTIDDVDYVGITYWFENRTLWKNENEDIKLYIPEEHVGVFTKHFEATNDHIFLNDKTNFVEGLGYQIIHDLVYLSPPHTYVSYDSIPINLEIYGRVIPGWFVSHQHAHAASTFFTSNFEKSAIFTVDATDTSPYSTSLFAWGNGNRIETLYFPGVMVGQTYSAFTSLLNIGHPLWKAGSTMGLAPYGKVDLDIVRNIEKYIKSYWEKNFDGDEWKWASNLFMRVTGKPIRRLNVDQPDDSLDNYVCDYFQENGPDCEEGMNAAATVQYIFEETMFKFINQLHDETKHLNQDNLCLAGGSFLNCTTNGKIYKRTPFKNVSPYPGSADDGLSVGCALFITHHILDIPRVYKSVGEVVYTGLHYDTPVGGKPLNMDFVAKSLNEGKVVAWFQGGSEFGPRALGNRSFLANPTLSEMRDYINFEIKNREWYRPFAPAVCFEDVNKYFDIEGESPYMLKICNVITDNLPSVTHVDGTARVQTVKKEDNPKFYEMLRRFEKYSGVAVLLNTSLNLSDEPIVETPQDAIKLFNRSKTDILVINDSMWVK